MKIANLLGSVWHALVRRHDRFELDLPVDDLADPVHAAHQDLSTHDRKMQGFHSLSFRNFTELLDGSK